MTGPSSRRVAIIFVLSPISSKLISPLIIALLAVLVSVAYASPTDPTWIAGFYDNADYDDAVTLLVDAPNASDRQGPTLAQQAPAVCILSPESIRVPRRTLRTQSSRGPPRNTFGFAALRSRLDNRQILATRGLAPAFNRAVIVDARRSLSWTEQSQSFSSNCRLRMGAVWAFICDIPSKENGHSCIHSVGGLEGCW